MVRRPPRSTRTDTLFPYTTLFRSTAFAGPGRKTRPNSLPNYHGWYVAIWAAGPALLLLAAWSFVQPSLVTADILSSYSAAERPQTDIERQALLAELNGLVSGSIERSEERRVGKEWVSTCRTGWASHD